MTENLPRKSIRLKDYDYSNQGCYFITACVKDGRALLWEDATAEAASGRPPLSRYGLIVESAVSGIPRYYPAVSVDRYAVMPNHIHIMLRIDKTADGEAPTVSTVVQQMKRSVSKRIGFSVWQKSFYDRIVRNAEEYEQIWKYIDENPMKWDQDEYWNGKQAADRPGHPQ